MSFPTATQATPEETVKSLLGAERVQRAFRFFEEQAAGIDEEHAALVRVPAPPFGEAERAEYLRERFEERGLEGAALDAEGNCVALRRGEALKPLLVLSAHLDTVFPAGTDCEVRREPSGLMRAPGIADDGCGLAALVALARALNEFELKTRGSILFVGTVGEEGEGDLRGVRHLLTASEWGASADAFISIDGPGLERITHAALASRRYRVTCRGVGGHSWGDFGVPNPVHALGRAVARLAAYPAPKRPRTTFNVGRIEGGSGVNVIPREARMDVDLRSESPAELGRLDAFFRRAARESAEDENASRRQGAPALEIDIRLIGDRPGGATAPEQPLVRLAAEATRSLGARPYLDCSSTDSNIAISRGLPAVTIGAGGASGNTHTLDEWYDPAGRDLGLKRALLVALGVVGLSQK
jgi:acetylornithine deacetylase/succinyl-diaminopimelate desuccinylase-like protein